MDIVLEWVNIIGMLIWEYRLPIVAGVAIFFVISAIAPIMESIQERRLEAAKLAKNPLAGKINIRRSSGEPKGYLKRFVDLFNLQNMFLNNTVRQRLAVAGLRGTGPAYIFSAARVVLPGVFFVVSWLYASIVLDLGFSIYANFGLAVGLAVLGYYAPTIYINNRGAKRQANILRAWPDTLDYLLICIESGLPLEAALKRVSLEVSNQSVPLFEELSTLNAELAFLDSRRKAFDNFAWRINHEVIKSVTTGLSHADRYGTSLGHTLRVLAADARKMRVLEAEKKAAALPPKLTVPMILFFLPVLFVVILTPAVFDIIKNF